ncbi:TraX protein [Amphibacillus marinus]|uniref:TraX protein n=1 Tax=Amphibacillus marinus TaxID=872970 RepID=A0A1H8TZ05_9BACI|nr:TraX family protein [Amphibacillus marinus]SEO95658.1 TraX protein [Amphibacillus marinus]
MTNTQLKIIALIAMFIDHYGLFISGTPELLGWIGRIAAPVFIYCVVIGFKNTSNRIKYLVRLGVAAVGMSFINLFINLCIYYANLSGPYLELNFFSTLFLIAFLIMLLENKRIKILLLFFAWQFISLILFGSLEVAGLISKPFVIFIGQISGNVLVVEGGPLIILLGLFFYFANDNRWTVTSGYSFYCLAMFYSVRRWGSSLEGFNQQLFGFADYQWMMIFALPLFLLYNGKKGNGLKYLFYIFYPLHTVILWYIGKFILP